MDEEKLNRDYKLMAFDLDDTLLNDEKQINDTVKEALNEAYEKGKILVFSTGRNIDELRDFRKIEAFRYAVAVNGSYIYDLKENKVLVSLPIPKESTDRLFDFLKINNIHIGAHSHDYLLDEEVLNNVERYHIENLYNTLKTNGILIPSVVDYYSNNEMEIFKVNLYLNSDEEREKVREELKPFEDEFEIVHAVGYTLELSKKGVNKGNGLKYLCEKLGIDIKDTIAIGDSENDLAAIEVAGLGIAMGNAQEKIKEAADVIVATNLEDGCKEAIEKYLLKK
ncbi:MAG: Cof-type HAD-IIB family hydrolase [Clostridia bacterium]|nr:Cof-type HAD-IIB family hydrolase [Clostridia bacterium]